ncbi:MAG: alpha-galactosidase [Dorea sp.]|nr:alpha-galactosidase [Dorea sp.]
MGILYNEQAGIFKLDALDTSYVIGIFDDERFVSHLYYGKKIIDSDVRYLYGPLYQVRPSVLPGQAGRIMDAVPFEYPTFGCGDYREHCLEVETVDGYHACDLRYEAHKIYPGKPALEGLPSTFEREAGDCNTLELVCRDKVLNLGVTLLYTVFEQLNVITRAVLVTNEESNAVYIKRALSGCVEFDHQNFDVLTLHGSWERECGPVRTPLRQGKIVTESTRGESGPTDNPFLAVLSCDATEDTGEVFAMNLVYSGNFLGVAQGHHFRGTRIVMGINPVNFSWKLEPGDTFTAPEVVMVYSDRGLGKMSRTFHDLYRGHLIRDVYPDTSRPVLINNWEATYFGFTFDRLIEIAAEASKCGIELFVLDDGWFGDRNDETKGLGDWFVNEEKLPGGIARLSKEINKLGMKFGLWIEPEMVSPDSKLFREHPDWAIQIPGRHRSLFRHQYVLDWSRREVRSHIYDMIHQVLSGANVEYIKWDMNRTLTEAASAALPADRQGELCHRYVLGVYEIMGRLREDFPSLLLENCSAGGSRFDPGVLYYSPQIWGSDDSDAIERIQIEMGASMCYPLSAIGAHVSAVPNHQTGRITPLETRGYAAMAGTFGYELNIAQMSEAEKAVIREQVDIYHKYNWIVKEGDLYRIGDPFANRDHACWMVVSRDKKEALVTYIQTHALPGYFGSARKLRLKGLMDEAVYRVEVISVSSEVVNRDAHLEGGQNAGKGREVLEVSGSALMNAGYWMERLGGDYMGMMIHLKAIV